MDLKKQNLNLYIISQCLNMFNFYLCCLRIYSEKLVIYSYGLIGVAVVLFILSGVYRSIKFTTIPVLFMILFGYMLFTDVVNSNFGNFDCYMHILCFVLCFFFSFFINNKEDNEKSLNYILWTCVISSTLMSILSLPNLLTPGSELNGIFTNRNVFAACSCISLFASYWLFKFNDKLSLKNIIILISSIINFCTLIMTKSRTPRTVLAGFIFVIVVYYAFFVFAKKYNKAIVYALFAILFILFIAVVLAFIINRNSFDNQGSLRNIINRISSGRIDIWEQCFKLIAESPITGVNNDVFHERLMDVFNTYFYHQHNVYIGLMTIHGIPSLIIYLIIIVYTVINGIKNICKNKDNSEIKKNFFYLAVLVGLLVGDLFESYTFTYFIPCGYLAFLMFESIESARLSN